MDQSRDQQPAHHYLQEAEPEDVMAQPPQPVRVQLQPDQEQEQDDADIGDIEQLISVADQG